MRRTFPQNDRATADARAVSYGDIPEDLGPDADRHIGTEGRMALSPLLPGAARVTPW